MDGVIPSTPQLEKRPRAGKARRGKYEEGRLKAPEWAPLFQGGEIGPEIDMVRMSVDDECRNGFHACGLGFSDPAFCLTEMHDLDIILPRVELIDELLLCIGADRASRMVENGFACHPIYSFSIAETWNHGRLAAASQRAASLLAAPQAR
jgi:hypothetical protein